MTIDLSFPAKSEYWSVVDNLGNIHHSGRLAPDQVLTTPFGPIIHDQNENVYLGSVNAVGPAPIPLPTAGAELQADDIYAWSGQNVIVRQSHIRTADDPDTVPALFSVYRASYDGMVWIANELVMLGDERTYEAMQYECIQSHTTQVDWSPPVVPTLWSVIPDGTGVWMPGVAYEIGNNVSYSGISYSCIQAHSSQVTWEPPATPALWSVV